MIFSIFVKERVVLVASEIIALLLFVVKSTDTLFESEEKLTVSLLELPSVNPSPCSAIYPSMVSFPSPSFIMNVSFPVPPIIVSFPANPFRVLAPEFPVIISS